MLLKNRILQCYNRDMDVYIEYVIIDNFVITFMISALTYKLMLKRVAKLRSAIAAIVGTAIAIAYPFVYNDVLVIVIKLGLWIALSLILFAGKPRLLLCSLTFLAITFLFGGAMFGINYLASGDAYSAMRVNTFDFPISVVIVGTFLCYCFVKKIAISIHKRHDICGSIYKFSVGLFGKTLELSGLMDTGNRLYDERAGLPVVVIGIKSLLGVLDNEQIVALSAGRIEAVQRGARYFEVSTAAKKGKILLLKPDFFKLYSDKGEHILYDVTVGVSFAQLGESTEYDAILHPAIIQNYRPETETRRSA